MDPGGTALFDARSGFNELNRLVMLWTVFHCWPEGGRFAFNCYRYWAHILLRHPVDTPFIILGREGVTQGYPLLMFLYGIILVPLVEELRDDNPTLLPIFYADDSAFDGSVRQSAE